MTYKVKALRLINNSRIGYVTILTSSDYELCKRVFNHLTEQGETACVTGAHRKEAGQCQ